jgi:methionyl-tRNA formyltransferase
MVESLRGLQAGAMQPQKQDNARATLAPILKKEDGRIDFARGAQEICNRLRGFQLWPGAFTSFRGKGLNITAIKLASEQVPQAELLVRNGQLFVGCGNDSAIELLELQPEGKKRMSGRDFAHGYRPQAGESLGV